MGLVVICAALIGVANSSPASAAGTLAFECAATASGAGFKAEHCTPGDAVASGAIFKHVEIPLNTKFEVEGTNAKTASSTSASTPITFKGKIAGIEASWVCEVMVLAAAITNEAPVPFVWKVAGMVATFLVCKLTGPLSGGALHCKLASEEIVTSKLKAEVGETMEPKFVPESGETIATFKLTGCSMAGLNTEYKITGNLKMIPSGATLEIASGSELKLAGSTASLAGQITLRKKGGNPIGFTTV